jgi:hypothetical protein
MVSRTSERLRKSAGLGRVRLALRADAQRAEEYQHQHRDHQPGNHVEDHDLAPGEEGEKRADRERRERIAHVAAHAVQRQHESLALREAARERGDRGGMPEAVAEPDQRHAREQHEVAVAESHQQIREADPEERHRHQHALAPDGIHQDSARHVRDRARDVLAGHDEADLAVGEAHLPADDRQDEIERRRVPVRERVAEGDEPHLAKRARRNRVPIDTGTGKVRLSRRNAHLPAFLRTTSS